MHTCDYTAYSIQHIYTTGHTPYSMPTCGHTVYSIHQWPYTCPPLPSVQPGGLELCQAAATGWGITPATWSMEHIHPDTPLPRRTWIAQSLAHGIWNVYFSFVGKKDWLVLFVLDFNGSFWVQALKKCDKTKIGTSSSSSAKTTHFVWKCISKKKKAGSIIFQIAP